MHDQINILEGNLVKLIPFLAARDSNYLAIWNRNSEYQRLAMERAQQYSTDNIKKWLEKEELSENEVFFMIQTNDDGRIIGNINL